jgi:phosphoheptose isomerase
MVASGETGTGDRNGEIKMNEPKTRTYEIYTLLMKRFPELGGIADDIMAAFAILKECYANPAGPGTVLLCGNGGSASDAEHIAGELLKGFLLKRPVPPEMRAKMTETAGETDGNYLADNLQGALPAISLVSQSAITTAFANDVAPDMAFAQQVYAYGRPGDVLIGLSTSGNSKNVLNAVKVAKTLGMKTIGMTAAGGGKLAALCDATVKAPAEETFLAQEYHLPIYHALCAMVESEFFDL